MSITPCIRFLLLLVAVALAACGGAPSTESLQPGAESPQPVVIVGGAGFKVELAITQEQRTQGLSGRTSLAPGTGMLFVFNEEGRYSFWMKEMRFPLDLVWIGPSPLSGEGCAVVDISHKAPPPAPGQGLAELPLYTPGTPARYVLEVNGGETEAAGVRVDSRVEFRGTLAGLYGC